MKNDVKKVFGQQSFAGDHSENEFMVTDEGTQEKRADPVERFTVDLRKGAFTSINPGQETRKTIAVFGIIIIAVGALAIAGLHVLKSNIATTGLTAGGFYLMRKLLRLGGPT